MDPLTITAAVGIASKAFETIKAGFQLGKDVESMAGDLGRWMGAVSDVDNAEKQAKNPPLFKKLMYASSIEQTALEAFAAKKKLAQQRQELKTFFKRTKQVFFNLIQAFAHFFKFFVQTFYFILF